MEVGLNPGTVRAHPLHIFTSCDLTSLYVYSSNDGVVVDDVPDVIAHLLEPDILALESVAQEVLTGSSEGPAAAHSSDLEVARIFGLREATWILLC